MALAWHSASTAWLASGPRIKQLLGKGNCRNCLHNRLKPVKYQTVPGTEQAPSKDGFFSLCFLSCYSTGWHPALLAAHPDSSLLPSPDNRTSLSFWTLGVCVYVCVKGGVCVCTQSCLFQPHGLLPARLLCSWNSPGKNTGVGSHFLPQGIFPTQGSNLHLLYLLKPFAPLNSTVWECCPVPQFDYLSMSQTLHSWGLHACSIYCLLRGFLWPTWVTQLNHEYQFISQDLLLRILCWKKVQGLV